MTRKPKVTSRSELMSRVRSKDTKPELIVRKALHARGFRYRLHVKDLPGKPDLVFPSRKAVIFVHGCFWHGHEGCGRMPKSRQEFWGPKIERNKERDREAIEALLEAQWRVLVVWECAMSGPSRWAEHALADEIAEWLWTTSRLREISGNVAGTIKADRQP